MMKKNNSGITLVSLVITIIVLLILSSITIYSGVSTVRSARLTKFTTEMKLMQEKVNELYYSYTNDGTVTVNGTEYVGTDIQNIGEDPESLFNSSRLEEVFSTSGSGITDREGYMYYDMETLEDLGLEDMEYEFFVNVSKRSVVSIEGFNYYGNIYYTLEQLPDSVYNVEYNNVDGNLSYEVTSEIQNGQGKLHIVNISYNQYVSKWQIRYRIKVDEGEEENSWTTTESFTGTEYTIDIPIENIFEDYEVQVIHGDEIISEIKTAHVLQIGDYINYDPTDGATITSYTSPQGTYNSDNGEDGTMTQGNGYADQVFDISDYTDGWRVLGIDEDTNEILLVSEKIVQTTSNEYFCLRGQTGYQYGVEELNNICAIYGTGTGASGARSINVDDINKITGYDPTNTGTGLAYGSGYIYEYGNQVTYTNNGSSIAYSGSNEISDTTSNYSEFRYFEGNTWKSLVSGESTTLTNTGYYYFPVTLATTRSSSEDVKGISADSTEYEMLFEETYNEQFYWLASTYTYTDSGNALFGLRYVVNAGVYYFNNLFSSDGDESNTYLRHSSYCFARI